MSRPELSGYRMEAAASSSQALPGLPEHSGETYKGDQSVQKGVGTFTQYVT